MSTNVVIKKLMMFESFGGVSVRCSTNNNSSSSPSATGRRRMKDTPFPSSCIFTNQRRRFTSEQQDGRARSVMMMTRRKNKRALHQQQQHSAPNADSSTQSTKMGFCCSANANAKVLLYNLPVFVIVFVTMMNFARVAECVPAATVENLDSKIKMFLESHCTMQNQTLEHEEFKSFMACGPSHGAGIVKNLGRIPEYKSDDTDQWAKATKREIISQCQVWPHDRTCQKTTFRLIEKCFEKDQKFIFYFMFALTDVICQSEQSDLFVKFWQNGGDVCLGNHIKNLKKDWSDCFVKTSTVSNDDVFRNVDEVMQCFRNQFDTDCFGEGADEVLNEIMTEIRRVYLETYSTASSASAATSLQAVQIPIILLAGLMTFLL